jgi:uncharacterized protein YjdB
MRNSFRLALHRRWRQHALRAIVFAGTLSCSTDALDPGRATVTSVVVTPDRLTVGVGASATLAVELRDAGGNRIDGRKVVWASKDPSVATVSGSGVVTGMSPGSVQVAATAEGKTAVVDVTVNPKAVASVRLTPNGSLGLLVGQTRQVAAEPLASDGDVLADRPVTWASTASEIATVSEDGLITAVAPGGAVITASSEGQSAVLAVTVSTVPVASVDVTPAADNVVVVTQTLQLTAVVKDVAGAPLPGRVVTWSTTDPAIATVSSTGLVTGVAPGDATISASSGGKIGSVLVTVNPKPVGAVIVSPSQLSLEPGQTRQISAQVTDADGNVLTGRTVEFTSENPAIATVSASGLVVGVTLGSTRVIATSEGKTGTADVTVIPAPVATVVVTPAQASIVVGGSAQLTAVARDSRGNVVSGRRASWSTGAPSVATVSADGLVTGVGDGTAIIFATIDGRTGSATADVRRAAVTSVTVTPGSSNVAVGSTLQLTAIVRSGETVLSDRVVGLTSSNPTVASVSSSGVIDARKAGLATITATSEGVSGTASVAVGITRVVVSPSSTTVEVGQTRQLVASARDANNNNVPGVPFVWTTSAAGTATVSSSGLVTGVSEGSVAITATFQDIAGSSSVLVLPRPVADVDVTPSSVTLARGGTAQLTATLRDASGNILTGRTVTWSSSNEFVAKVDSDGLVTASTLLTGNVTITARSEGRAGKATVRVTLSGQ